MVDKAARTPISPWAKGETALVFAYEDFDKDLDKANTEDARKIRQTLKEHFCEFGKVASEKKWNPNEGTHKIEKQRVKLQAVKAFQCRAYGVIGSHNGMKAFFISMVDPKKKQDKASPELLKRAAEKALELINQIDGAKL